MIDPDAYPQCAAAGSEIQFEVNIKLEVYEMKLKMTKNLAIGLPEVSEIAKYLL